MDEVLEVIKVVDKDEVGWIIERWTDYTVLIYNDAPWLVPDASVDTLVLEETDFESYCKLREIVRASTTYEIWNKINLAASMIERMIMEAPQQEGN